MDTTTQLLVDAVLIIATSVAALSFGKEELKGLYVFVKAFLFLGIGLAAIMVLVKVIGFMVGVTR